MPSNIQPSIKDVATIIRSRTRSQTSGIQEGTFNENTKPDATQAQKEIRDALDELLTEIGIEEIPDSVAPQVRSLVAFLAAANIELSYYNEQVAANKSSYQLLMGRYEKRLPRVVKAVERALEGDDSDSSVELLPQFNFPDGSDPQGMIGWGSQLG
jgi:hypothetical protein